MHCKMTKYVNSVVQRVYTYHASDGDRFTSNTHGRILSSSRMSKPYNSRKILSVVNQSLLEYIVQSI